MWGAPKTVCWGGQMISPHQTPYYFRFLKSYKGIFTFQIQSRSLSQSEFWFGNLHFHMAGQSEFNISRTQGNPVRMYFTSGLFVAHNAACWQFHWKFYPAQVGGKSLLGNSVKWIKCDNVSSPSLSTFVLKHLSLLKVFGSSMISIHL